MPLASARPARPGRATLAVLGVLLLAGCAQPAAPGTSTADAPAAHTVGVGATIGHYRIDAIHADRLEGMDRTPYPVLHGDGKPRTVRVGDEVGAACEGRTYVLTSIDAGAQTATFTPKDHAPSQGGCPICLSADTLIDTPSGPVPVPHVRVGMQVWALVGGERVVAPVADAGRSAARDHVVVRLALEDGRALEASPGHPTADGRLVGELRAGDVVDGARVVGAELVPYAHAYTYDLRAGDAYFANGIPLGSTLGR